MTAQGNNLLKPASMIDRIVARGLDALIASMIFVVAYSPFIIVITLSITQSMLTSGDNNYEIELTVGAALAALIAVVWEPFRQTQKRRTFGRSTVDIHLRLHARPSRVPTGGRVFVRHFASLGACVIVIVVVIIVSGIYNIDMTPWRIVGLVSISCLLVWLSALLSACCRADRRGWHDVLAGTMLVTVRQDPVSSARVNQPQQHSADGGQMGSEER